MMLLGLARRRASDAAAAAVAAAAAAAWHGAQDSAIALPAAFLCPVLSLNQPATARRRQERRSTRASTSYAPFRPTRPAAANRQTDDDAQTVLRQQIAHQSPSSVSSASSSSALSMIPDVASSELASLLHPKDRSSSGSSRQRDKTSHATSNPPLDEMPRTIGGKNLQRLSLARAVVLDVLKQPAELLSSDDDVELLRDAENTFFDVCKLEIELLETLVPELASAYLHVERGARAVELLRRYRACFTAAGRPVSLLAWKVVLARAFTQGDYDLTVRLIEAGSPGPASSDDWAIYARFESLLRIVEHHLPTSLQGVELVDQFWLEYERDGRTAPVEMFTTLIKSQARRGLSEGLKETLQAQLRHGHPIESRVWRFMIQIHPRGRTAGVFRNLPAKLGLDTVQVLNELVRHFADRKDIRRSLLAWRCFSVGIDAAAANTVTEWRPRISSLQPLVELTGRLRMPNAMLRILHTAVQLEVDVDMTQTLHRVVRTLLTCGRPHDALAISLQLLGSQASSLPVIDSALPPLPVPAGCAIVSISRGSYSAALRACAAYKNPREAVLLARIVLSDMFRYKLEANRVIFHELINVFRRTIVDTEWLHFVAFLNKIARELGQQGTQITRFVNMVHSRGVVDDFVSRTRNKLPGGARDARESLNWMTQPSHLHADVLPMPAPKSTDLNVGTKRVSELLNANRFDPNPDVHVAPFMSDIAYAMRLRMFSIVLRDHASAMAILRHMLQFRAKPTTMHIAIIVEGLVLSDRLQEAEDVCRDARMRHIENVETDQRIATAFVRGHARRGDWKAVMQELNKMTQRGVYISPSLAASVQSKFEMFWEGRRNERIKAKKDATKLTEKTLKDLSKTAQRFAMYKSLTDEERRAVRKRMTNPSALSEGGGGGGGGGGGHSTQRHDVKQVKAPSARTVTIMYKSMFDAKRYEWAGLYMAKALDAGMLSDETLRIVLKRTFKYLRTLAAREALDPEKLLEARSPQFWVEIDRTPARHEDGKNGVKWSRMVDQRRVNKAHTLSPLLQLYHHNRQRASVQSPDRQVIRQNERDARRAFFSLLEDAFVNNALLDEADQKNKDSSPLAVPLYAPHRQYLDARNRSKIDAAANTNLSPSAPSPRSQVKAQQSLFSIVST